MADRITTDKRPLELEPEEFQRALARQIEVIATDLNRRGANPVTVMGQMMARMTPQEARRELERRLAEQTQKHRFKIGNDSGV